MSNTEVVGNCRIEFKGIYDFGGLYRLISNWIMDKKYRLHEKKYKDKINSPHGTEVEIDLHGRKKETFYTRNIIDVSLHAWDYREQEGMLHGEKTLYTGGRIIIAITTSVEFDWQDIFSGSKINETMGKLYAWIMKKELLQNHVDVQEYEALKLEFEVKKFLKMESDTHAY